MNTPLDPTVIARMARTLDELHSVPIMVLPDEDARFEDLKPGHVVSNGTRFYVPESLWPKLRAELLKLRQSHRLQPVLIEPRPAS